MSTTTITRTWYEISDDLLGDWLEAQGADLWWLVDGDWRLPSKVLMPCPGDELAAEIRKVGKPLLVAVPPHGKPEQGPPATVSDLDRFADRDPSKNRLFLMRWKDRPEEEEWLLLEDLETSELERQDLAQYGSM